MLKNLKIGVRLGAGFGLLFVLMGVLVFFGYSRVGSLHDTIYLLVEDRMVKTRQANDAIDGVNEVARALRNMVLLSDAKAIEAEEQRIMGIRESVGKVFDTLEATITSDEGRRLMARVQETRRAYFGPQNQIMQFAKAGQDAEATALLLGEFRRIQGDYMNAVIGLVGYQTSLANKEGHDAEELSLATQRMLLILAAIALLLGIGSAWFITRSITGPVGTCIDIANKVAAGETNVDVNADSNDEVGKLMQALKQMIGAIKLMAGDASMLAKAAVAGELSTRADASKHHGDFQKIVQGVNDTLDAVISPVNEAASVLEKVAARDMTARVQGNYNGDLAKIKNSLNLAVENLDTALGQVANATGQVASASGQISAGSQALAQGANEQASALEEVSSSLEEMSSMTKQNAENANNAKNLAADADNSARVGSEAMSRMSGAINRIKESSDQTAKIVKTIDEIAMQTNLLALNAAVEAARAGEAGRGFAVVAEEVRNLAQRSAQAAKNTADMIGESVQNAEVGVKIAGEVSKSFEAIAGSAKKVNDLIAEIAAASREQSQGIEQVNTAVSQMDKVTQQNAANSEESASAAEELSSQAEELQNMVGQFSISASIERIQAPKQAAPKSIAPPENRAKSHVGTRKLGPSTHRKITAEDIIPMNEEALKEF